MKQPGKILIIRLSSLGDIIHTLPAFHSLRDAFPEARIDWLVESRLAYLLRAVEGIDEILPIDTRSFRANLLNGKSWQGLMSPVRIVRSRRYDRVIDFQGLIKTAFLSCLSGARMRIGFSRELVRERPAHWFYHRTPANPASPVHVARLNMLVACAAGAQPAELRAHLRADPNDVRAVETKLQEEQLCDFIVINPGGGWPTKRWDPVRFGSLSELIHTKLGKQVVVVTGPGEEPLYRAIADQCREKPPVHLPLPFMQLIPLFEKARLVVAGDTGPLHLACALETPVVALMGPTDPIRNGPWSGKDEVVVRSLPCSFCHGRSCPTANECMDIPVDEVFAAIVRRLERTA
jgi:heptosyltransferase I